MRDESLQINLLSKESLALSESRFEFWIRFLNLAKLRQVRLKLINAVSDRMGLDCVASMRVSFVKLRKIGAGLGVFN